MNTEDSNQKNVFVWYACYGSNLLEERFNCYLRGGRVDGMSRTCVGARDSTPAQESLIRWMPYRVFFASPIRSAWGYGGPAMLDPSPNQRHKSCMRLYKVTLEQFNDVVAQENGVIPPLPVASTLTCEHITDLRRQAPGSVRQQFESGYYPAVVYLGDQDDLPVVTFTCLTEKAKQFLRGTLSAAPPANNYLTVLRRGLQDSGLDETTAIAYWNDVIAQQFEGFEAGGTMGDEGGN
jgi:histone deacetylase 4/5